MFGKLFKRRRPGLIETLQTPPTMDEEIALRLERMAEDRLDALRDGEHVISGYTNCVPGTRAWTLRCLAVEGLMRAECSAGFPGEGGRWRYTPTDAGRAMLANA